MKIIVLTAAAIGLAIACGGTTEPRGGAPDAGGATVAPTATPTPTGTPSGRTSTPGSVACGDRACVAEAFCCEATTTSGGSCSTDPSSCTSSEQHCDDGTDCKTGLCCAEVSADGSFISTFCRPNCITNIPRVQVCVTDADCTNHQPCKDWGCTVPTTHGRLTTCGPVGACD